MFIYKDFETVMTFCKVSLQGNTDFAQDSETSYPLSIFNTLSN